jgi:hypothetical protein
MLRISRAQTFSQGQLSSGSAKLYCSTSLSQYSTLYWPNQASICLLDSIRNVHLHFCNSAVVMDPIGLTGSEILIGYHPTGAVT